MAEDTPEALEPGPGPGKDPAPVQLIALLTVYLVAITGVLLWAVYEKWPVCYVTCTDPITASASPTPTATPTPTPTPTATPTPTPTPPPGSTSTPTPSPTPDIEVVSPKTGLMDCSIQVTIKGKNFEEKANAIFGGIPATTLSRDPNGTFLIVRPPAHTEGEVDVVVRNPNGATSDIEKAAYTYTCPPTPERDLFLLVVFAGAIGGALHGMRSLYWYTGLRNFMKSWILMYILAPLIGATMAIIFYAVIRAGFLTVTSKSSSLGIIAIALLVGLFSSQAAVKLKDIANAVLAKPEPGPPRESRPQDSTPPGKDPKAGATKPVINPPKGAAGTEVKITGTGMKKLDSVTFGAVAATKKSIAADGTITATVPPQTSGTTGPVEVAITGDKGTVKSSFTYE